MSVKFSVSHCTPIAPWGGLLDWPRQDTPGLVRLWCWFWHVFFPKTRVEKKLHSPWFIIWLWVKTLVPSEPQNSWDLWMFIPLKCIYRYWPIPIYSDHHVQASSVISHVKKSSPYVVSELNLPIQPIQCQHFGNIHPFHSWNKKRIYHYNLAYRISLFHAPYVFWSCTLSLYLYILLLYIRYIMWMCYLIFSLRLPFFNQIPPQKSQKSVLASKGQPGPGDLEEDRQRSPGRARL